MGLDGAALADGGLGGGMNGGSAGLGYSGAIGGDGSLHGGGGGGAAGDLAGGAGGAGGSGAAGTGSGPGGAGGAGGKNNQNGASAGNGSAGANGISGASTNNGGGSGGGGGGGGAGFHYATNAADLLAMTGVGVIQGGNGGKGGKGAIGGGAGGKGGTGGAGILMDDGFSVTVNVTSVTGGNGGKGGDGADQYSPGTSGFGGNGGAGVVVSSGGSVSVTSGTIRGGNGGDGGSALVGRGGDGGAGGAGLSLSNGGSISVASGVTIIAGNGGTPGTGPGGGGAPVIGLGGAGTKVTGGGASVTIAGSVSGGMNGTNTVRAAAIALNGGNNTLTLQNGYAFTGNVTSDGAGDTLALGGSSNGSFDLSQLGTTFLNFSNFKKTGASTWTLSGTGTFGGPTTITGGTLAFNNATLASSPISVSSGGTLSVSGSSSVSSLDIYGVVAMADATALLQSGSTTFESGSTFFVQSDTTGTGKIQATSAQINGGTVKVRGTASSALNYVILSGPTVTGTFDGAQAVGDFIVPTLHYDVSGEVYLTFTVASFSSVARTANQQQIAAAIDAQGPTGPLAAQLSTLTADEARAAYDALSGNSYASTETAAVEQSFTAHDMMVDRLLSHASNHLWGKVFSTVENGGGGNASPYTSRTGGALGGMDGVIGDWRIGAMLGYGRGAFATATSSEDSAQYYTGIYASTAIGNLRLRTGAGYTRAQIDAMRKVVVGALSDTLTGSYGADVGQAFAELGYKLDLGGGHVEPFGSLTKVLVRTGALTETGGTTALSVAAATQDITLATLGLHGQADFILGTTAATFQATLAWQHAFGSAPRTAMTFQSGGSFTADGAPLATDSAVVRADLGLTVAPDAVLSLSYAGQFSAGTISQTANAEFNVQF